MRRTCSTQRSEATRTPSSDRQRGAAAVEFAIVLPILLMLVFGTIDFGYMINRTTLLNNAAREGAREAIFNPDEVAIEARVRDAIDDLDQAQVTVTVTCKDPAGFACPGASFADEWQKGGAVVVNVQYVHDFLTPAAAVFGLGASRTLSSTVEMRIEG